VQRRILLLITDLKIGGTPTVVRELALRLRGIDGFHVEVACLDQWGPVADELRAAGLEVTALNAKGPSDFTVGPRLVRLIRGHHINTLLSFLVHANAAAAGAKMFCPGVRLFQSIQTTQPTPKWHWRVQAVAQHAAEKVVVPSPSVAAVAREWAAVPEEKIIIIPNAIEMKDFAPIAREGRAGNRVGFIGRLDPIKRVIDLVNAVAMLPDVILHVYGEGEDRKPIEAEIDRLKLAGRVTLHGTIARPQQALAEIDLLVLPSEAEGFGLVLIEAMAAGVPVVATDVPGIRDVITDGITGILTPARNPEKLAMAIKRLLADEVLKEKLTTQARLDIEKRFSWEKVLPMYSQILAG
jgi:glycosyltransferase involved in cell wall biosynthesis